MHLAGAQKVVLDLAKNLNPNKFSSMIVSLYGGVLLEEARRANIKVVCLEPKGVFDIVALMKLVILMKKEKIDIVHSHGFNANYYGAIAAKIANIPVCIITEHGRYWLERRRRILMTKLAAGLAKITISVSEDLREVLIETLKLSPHKVITVYSGIDLKEFSPNEKMDIKKEFGINPEMFVVGNVANLRPVKGQIYLLKAIPKVIKVIPNIKIIIVGEGESRKELENVASELNISEHVIFLGQRQDIASILNIVDVFVISSLSEEISLAILEAMAMKKAVIATRVGGNPEIISNGATGLLVPPKDENILSEAIIRLLKDKKFALELGERAYQLVKERFCLEVMIKNVENLYEELINRKNKAADL